MFPIKRQKVILITFLVFFVAILGYASADVIFEPNYTHTTYIAATLDISGGTASSSGEMVPHSSPETRVVYILVVLERYEDGVWHVVKSWSNTAYNTMASAGGTWTVPAGYKYKTYVSGKIFTGEGVLLEHVTKNSPIVNYGAAN